MRQINELTTDALRAQEVDSTTDIVQEVVEEIESKNAMATDNVTIDGVEGDFVESTIFWNDQIHVSELEAGQFGGETKIIKRRDDGADGYFIGVQTGGMGGLGSIGGSMGGVNDSAGGQNSDEMQYLYADPETASEMLSIQSPEDGGYESTEFYVRAVQEGDVFANVGTYFFERRFTPENTDWLEPETFKNDVVTNSVHIILTYDAENEQLDRQLLTIENEDGNNTYIFSNFLHGVETTVDVPDPSDENVVDMDEMMGGLFGGMGDGGLEGLGEGGLGGGLGDALFGGDSKSDDDDFSGDNFF